MTLRRPAAAAVTVALVAAAVFAPVLWQGFADWDDAANFVNNPGYRGLGWTQIRWMFTTAHMGPWIPLSWITLGLDYVVWGTNPFGYHLTNLLLHAANAALVVLLGRRLLRRALPSTGDGLATLGAAVAGFVFAVHPLRVESVAWITQRRDVLSGFFVLGTILAYLRAADTEGATRRRWRAASFALYACALLAKPIVVTLPVVLVVLDVYPLRRLGGRWQDWAARTAWPVWREKLVYLAMAAVISAVAVLAMGANAGLTGLDELPLTARLALTAYSLAFYVSKTVMPFGLSPLYELPRLVSWLEPRFLASAAAVVAAAVVVVARRRQWPGVLAASIAYVVMVLPVSGLLHNGHQLVHDRYSYLACLGWAVLAGAAVVLVARVAARGLLGRAVARVAVAGACLIAVGLATVTLQQVAAWSDGVTLWSSAVAAEPDCSICHQNLGSSVANLGFPATAVTHFERALALRPDRDQVHGNLGVALLDAGRAADAVPHLERVLVRRPHDAGTRASLGVALVRQGEVAAGLTQLAEAARRAPGDGSVLTSVGIGLADAGRPADAVLLFKRAIEMDAANALPHFWLAKTYRALGADDSARAEYAVFRALAPALAERLAPPHGR